MMIDYEKLAKKLLDSVVKQMEVDKESPTVAISVKDALDLYQIVCGMNKIHLIVDDDHPGAERLY